MSIVILSFYAATSSGGLNKGPRGQGVGGWNYIWKVISMLGKGDTAAIGSLLGMFVVSWGCEQVKARSSL